MIVLVSWIGGNKGDLLETVGSSDSDFAAAIIEVPLILVSMGLPGAAKDDLFQSGGGKEYWN